MKSILCSTLLLSVLMMSSVTEAKSTPYTIAYSSSESNQIYLTNIEGTSKIKITDFAGGNGYSAWSPDGKRIAFYAKYDEKKTWSIHTMNSDGTNRRRLTHENNKWDYGPAFSPDGKAIAFSREYKDIDKTSHQEIWIMNSDGSQQTQLKKLRGGAPDFTPDNRIVFNAEFKDKKSEISIADIDGNNLIQLTDNEFEEWHPEVSPDGKQIAYMSNRDGNHEIYLMNIDGTDQKRLTFNDVDDWYPSWSPDGSQLIFSSTTGGKRNVYIMNRDGSSVKKIISNGGQAAFLHSDNKDKLSVLEGPYIGQKPPGLTPEVFAPGIVSKEDRDWTGRFTPDMKEYHFGRNFKKTGKTSKLVFKFENNRWYESEAKPHMGGAISPDGKTMYSGNQYRERTDNGWSELKSLGAPYEEMGIMVITVSSKGTYVFDDYKSDKLRYSRLINGNREAPKAFGKGINTGKWTAHPFIAPDESYMIWDSEHEGGYGGSDLYISFRNRDGTWGDAINFGDKINTEGPDTGGVVSPDGKYLFFNKKISAEDSDTFWVDAQIIETLRPKL